MTRRSQPGSASPSRPPHLRYPRKHSVQGIAIAGPRRLTVTPGPGSDLSYLAGIALVISAFWHHHNWPCETLLADGTQAGRRDPPSSSAAPTTPRASRRTRISCGCTGSTENGRKAGADMHMRWRDVSLGEGPFISTSVTVREAAELAGFADGQAVLEIGSAFGYSAVVMALAGGQGTRSTRTQGFPDRWRR